MVIAAPDPEFDAGEDPAHAAATRDVAVIKSANFRLGERKNLTIGAFPVGDGFYAGTET
jgi:hypothetical protein